MKDPLQKESFEKKAALIFAALSAGLYAYFKKLESGAVRSRLVARRMLSELVDQSAGAVGQWTEEAVPQMYKLGMLYGIQEMKRKGLDVLDRTRLTGIHREELARLVDTERLRLMESMEGVKKNAFFSLDEAFRIQAKAKVLEGVERAEAIGEIKRDVRELIKARGFDGLRDAGGKVWDLDTYSEMAVRTIHTEVHNTAITNVALENGYDLVQITSHAGSCKLCAPWEGEVLSLTGTSKGYDSMESAKSDGLFHCNCKHSFTPITPEEAEQLPG